METPIRLFGAFNVTEWSEDAYVYRPPFVVENTSGKVFVIPRDTQAESALDSISSSLGLKKVRQGHVSYLVNRGRGIKALREFDWYVRRSWRSKGLRVLWALAYLGQKRDWSLTNLRLDNVADAAGLTAQECNEALLGLFHVSDGNVSLATLSEFGSDRGMVQQTIQKKIAQLPIWTEEMVMGVLCNEPGASVSELHEAVLAQGLSVGAVYKLTERLKTQEYVYPLRHYRVNERGPMREMLTADCRNCFFGYTSPDSCLADTLRQIDDVLGHNYGKRPGTAERAALHSELKSTPYASRTNRRVLSSLRLMHQLDSMIKDGSVSSMLKKLEEVYGVSFPIKAPQQVQ